MNYVNNTRKIKIILSPLRLGSVSRINCPHTCTNFKNLLPSINLSPLKQPCHLTGGYKINGCNSPKFTGNRAFPIIHKCGTNRCGTCSHIVTSSTVKSNVNGRNFSINTKHNLDCNSKDVIYVIT